MPGHLGGKPIGARLVLLQALIERDMENRSVDFIKAVNTPWRCTAEELVLTGRTVRHLIYDQLWQEFESKSDRKRKAGLKMLQKTADGMKTRPIELEDLEGILIQPWAKLQKGMAKQKPCLENPKYPRYEIRGDWIQGTRLVPKFLAWSKSAQPCRLLSQSP